VKSNLFRNQDNPIQLAAPIRWIGVATAMVSIAAVTMCSAQVATQPTQTAASMVDAGPTSGGFGSVSRSVSMGKTIHVTLGHSIFINTKTRLRRVYIADPAIVTSVTLNPNQIIVTAMTPGVSSLTLVDESGQAQSYLVSSDVDVDGLRSAMAGAMRSDAVKVEASGGRVTLTGTVTSQASADAAVKLASTYSKDVADALAVVPGHPKQVRLEVRILEVDRSKLLQLGINLFNPGGTGNFIATSTSAQFPSASTLSSAGSGIGTLTTTNPLSFLLYNAKLNLGATIQDLQTKQVLQILAEPNITTISGVKADFLSGGEFPFPVVQPGSGSGSAPVISIQFRPFGVKVEFTPIVNEDGTIRLKVAPEVSALDYSNAIAISGITVPALSTRRAETEVELRSDQSFAISGLLDQRTTDAMSKNPGAADIPIIGALFKSKTANHSTTELIVVVTPTVVDPLTDATVPEQPSMPIPTLDTGSFDKSLGRNLNPQPAAPPINVNRPPNGNVPAPPAAEVTPAPEAGGAVSQDSAAKKVPEAKTTEPVAPVVPAAAAKKTNVDTSPMSTKRETPSMPGRVSTTATVEIMALSHPSDADAMVTALKRHGYDVAVNHHQDDALLHLDIGPFSNRKDAELMRQRLLLDGYNASIK
jgi:pilus assembly protein CpaC